MTIFYITNITREASACFGSFPGRKCSLLPGLLFGVILVCFCGCQPEPSNRQGFDMPRLSSPEFARGFAIAKTDEAHYVQTNLQNDTMLYVKGLSGEAIPAGAIALPDTIQRLVVLSTTHIAFVDILHALDAIHGVPNPALICNSEVREAIVNEKILPVSMNGQVDVEAVLALEPDLVLASSLPGQSSELVQIQQLGIPVLSVGEWLEPTVLGRTEWMRLFGVLLGKEKRADSLFAIKKARYQAFARRGKMVDQPLQVVCNVPYEDIWYVPGGNNYMANLLADAGIIYPWAQTDNSGSLALDVETVYPIALQADAWLLTSNIQSLAQLTGRDERFARFAPVENGMVFSSNRITCERGSEFWETGVVNPEKMLGDLLALFYPELMPGYQLHYYQKIQP